jgi:NADH:ubiquinone oxidoreductase subunit 3 (subunit A)
MDGWLGVVIMIGLGIGFAATMIGASLLLARRTPRPRSSRRTNAACPPVGDARERHSVSSISWR